MLQSSIIASNQTRYILGGSWPPLPPSQPCTQLWNKNGLVNTIYFCCHPPPTIELLRYRFLAIVVAESKLWLLRTSTAIAQTKLHAGMCPRLWLITAAGSVNGCSSVCRCASSNCWVRDWRKPAGTVINKLVGKNTIIKSFCKLSMVVVSVESVYLQSESETAMLQPGERKPSKCLLQFFFLHYLMLSHL